MTKSVLRTIARNEQKQRVLYRLSSEKMIGKSPYAVYYFSRNMEHKHDCFILSSEGEVLADVFTIPNNAEGFDTLLQTIRRCARPEDKIIVGLEAT